MAAVNEKFTYQATVTLTSSIILAHTIKIAVHIIITRVARKADFGSFNPTHPDKPLALNIQ